MAIHKDTQTLDMVRILVNVALEDSQGAGAYSELELIRDFIEMRRDYKTFPGYRQKQMLMFFSSTSWSEGIGKELADQIGYCDEHSFWSAAFDMQKKGYLEAQRRSTGNSYRLTKKGANIVAALITLGEHK